MNGKNKDQIAADSEELVSSSTSSINNSNLSSNRGISINQAGTSSDTVFEIVTSSTGGSKNFNKESTSYEDDFINNERNIEDLCSSNIDLEDIDKTMGGSSSNTEGEVCILTTTTNYLDTKDGRKNVMLTRSNRDNLTDVGDNNNGKKILIGEISPPTTRSKRKLLNHDIVTKTSSNKNNSINHINSKCMKLDVKNHQILSTKKKVTTCNSTILPINQNDNSIKIENKLSGCSKTNIIQNKNITISNKRNDGPGSYTRSKKNNCIEITESSSVLNESHVLSCENIFSQNDMIETDDKIITNTNTKHQIYEDDEKLSINLNDNRKVEPLKINLNRDIHKTKITIRPIVKPITDGNNENRTNLLQKHIIKTTISNSDYKNEEDDDDFIEEQQHQHSNEPHIVPKLTIRATECTNDSNFDVKHSVVPKLTIKMDGTLNCFKELSTEGSTSSSSSSSSPPSPLPKLTIKTTGDNNESIITSSSKLISPSCSIIGSSSSSSISPIQSQLIVPKLTIKTSPMCITNTDISQHVPKITIKTGTTTSTIMDIQKNQISENFDKNDKFNSIENSISKRTNKIFHETIIKNIDDIQTNPIPKLTLRSKQDITELGGNDEHISWFSIQSSSSDNITNESSYHSTVLVAEKVPKITIRQVEQEIDKVPKLLISMQDKQDNERIPKITIKQITENEIQEKIPKITIKHVPVSCDKDKFSIAAKELCNNDNLEKVPKFTIKQKYDLNETVKTDKNLKSTITNEQYDNNEKVPKLLIRQIQEGDDKITLLTVKQTEDTDEITKITKYKIKGKQDSELQEKLPKLTIKTIQETDDTTNKLYNFQCQLSTENKKFEEHEKVPKITIKTIKDTEIVDNITKEIIQDKTETETKSQYDKTHKLIIKPLHSADIQDKVPKLKVKQHHHHQQLEQEQHQQQQQQQKQQVSEEVEKMPSRTIKSILDEEIIEDTPKLTNELTNITDISTVTSTSLIKEPIISESIEQNHDKNVQNLTNQLFLDESKEKYETNDNQFISQDESDSSKNFDNILDYNFLSGDCSQAQMDEQIIDAITSIIDPELEAELLAEDGFSSNIEANSDISSLNDDTKNHELEQSKLSNDFINTTNLDYNKLTSSNKLSILNSNIIDSVTSTTQLETNSTLNTLDNDNSVSLNSLLVQNVNQINEIVEQNKNINDIKFDNNDFISKNDDKLVTNIKLSDNPMHTIDNKDEKLINLNKIEKQYQDENIEREIITINDVEDTINKNNDGIIAKNSTREEIRNPNHQLRSILEAALSGNCSSNKDNISIRQRHMDFRDEISLVKKPRHEIFPVNSNITSNINIDIDSKSLNQENPCQLSQSLINRDIENENTSLVTSERFRSMIELKALIAKNSEIESIANRDRENNDLKDIFARIQQPSICNLQENNEISDDKLVLSSNNSITTAMVKNIQDTNIETTTSKDNIELLMDNMNINDIKAQIINNLSPPDLFNNSLLEPFNSNLEGELRSPVKRPRGRPRKDGQPAGSVKKPEPKRRRFKGVLMNPQNSGNDSIKFPADIHSFSGEFPRTPQTTPVRSRGSRGGRGRSRGRGIIRNKPRCIGGLSHTPDMAKESPVFSLERRKLFEHKTPILQVFEEDTRMSADSLNITVKPPDFLHNEDTQSSTTSIADGSSTAKKRAKMEVTTFDGKVEYTADMIAEYDWPPPKGCCPARNRDTFMIQEQIAQYLGIKSFKRKYPDLPRRQIDMEERNYLREKGLVTEKMCDLGITAVWASDVLDIMYSDFYDKYEEYKNYLRQKQIRDIEAKQKALAAEAVDKSLQARERALQSASKWNSKFNKARKEDRRLCLDLQNLVFNLPCSISKRLNRPYDMQTTKPPSDYPLSLVPGQVGDNYRIYTPEELRRYPLNTILDTTSISNEWFHSKSEDEESSDSDSSSSCDSSSSDVTSSDESDSDLSSSSDEEETSRRKLKCFVCHQSQHKNLQGFPEIFVQCSACQKKTHPSCIEMPRRMAARVKEYSWQCADCKCCIKCKRKQDESKMLFCEQCDRGYHIYCARIKSVPEGRWHCEYCAICMRCGSTKPDGNIPQTISNPNQKPSRSKKAKWVHEYRSDHITKLREHSFILCAPCAKLKTKLVKKTD